MFVCLGVSACPRVSNVDVRRCVLCVRMPVSLRACASVCMFAHLLCVGVPCVYGCLNGCLFFIAPPPPSHRWVTPKHYSHRALWKNYSVEKYNASPNGAEKVLGAVDPDLVDKFNQTLAQQWEVYNYAVGLFRHRYAVLSLVLQLFVVVSSCLVLSCLVSCFCFFFLSFLRAWCATTEGTNQVCRKQRRCKKPTILSGSCRGE